MINLHFSIQTEDRIFLVLEYCDGGDLAAYLNQRGKVSEAVAKHFMRQLGMLGILSCFLVFLTTINTLVLLQNNNNKAILSVLMVDSIYCSAAGLQVLNENCLIHRDLKPQVWRFFSPAIV